MYWYLSFLRAPPNSISISADSLQITLQIANDLRTEYVPPSTKLSQAGLTLPHRLQYDPTDIAYTWQRVEHGVRSGSSEHGGIEYLTTWEPPQSTYKPIAISLPPGARAGESYRLALFALSNAGPSNPLIQYARPEPSVVPVWSDPILLHPRESQAGSIKGKTTVAAKGKNEGKQSRILRSWDVLGGQIHIIEQTSFDLDKVKPTSCPPFNVDLTWGTEDLGLRLGIVVLAMDASTCGEAGTTETSPC